jgi:hypothetical protein
MRVSRHSGLTALCQVRKVRVDILTLRLVDELDKTPLLRPRRTTLAFR